MSNQIKCPSCGHDIDVNEVFAQETEQRFKQQFQAEKDRLREAAVKQTEALAIKEKAFQDKVRKQNEIFKERLEKEKKTIKEELKSTVKKEYELQFNAQKEELDEKMKTIAELRGKAVEMERMKREMQDKEQRMELEYEKRIAKERVEYEEQIIKREHERNKIKQEQIELALREKDKKIEDMGKQVEEMKRKMEQGSMQLQGEVLELAIEEYLTDNFPFDDVIEIKKGARGADCMQIVHDGFHKNCGTIYYESKRTKNFSDNWIEKFKADMREKGADVGVLVTQSMPQDMEIMGERNGIWVCTYDEFKGLCYVLRQTVIRVARERSAQSNKGDKMTMLYDYLTGNEFRMQVEGIVEGFVTMKEDLDKEKRAMERIWKQREKQIEKVILNTSNMYGAVRGIAGAAIKPVEYLELPGAYEDED